MKVQFLGAARTVTGSCFIVETDRARFAVDCGMHQGSDAIEKRNRDMTPYDPARLDFILITHAHIDHSGLLPRVVRHGFAGPVYATEPTGDLLEILLLDSAHIQETEAAGRNKRLLRSGMKGDAVALYTQEDARAVLPRIRRRPYGESFSPAPGVTVRFQDAGHILGAASIELFIEEGGRESKLVFSGDIGRPNQLLMKDPTSLSDADYLFMESTYGDRNHKGELESLDELAQAIAYSYARGEKVIIPAFAVERTQEILYSLHLLSKEGRLPADMPVYLDSPLAIKATEIFRLHKAYLDAETQALLRQGEDPLNLAQLRFTATTEESIAINERREPAIVISASGMANAGRILHHLRHNLWRPGASVVFVGFQAQGTSGRKIVDGVQKIRIFNEDIAVGARVFTINGFSAHAGQSQLLEWLRSFKNKKMDVFLVHGENSAQKILATQIREKFRFDVEIPDYLEVLQLHPGRPLETYKPARVDARLAARQAIGGFRQKLGDALSDLDRLEDLPAGRQEELLSILADIESDLDALREQIKV